MSGAAKRPGSPFEPAPKHSRSPMKYILVVGGSVSGLGKGITASSIAVLLKACGWNVTMLKIDPYLNMDAGTMSPCAPCFAARARAVYLYFLTRSTVTSTVRRSRWMTAAKLTSTWATMSAFSISA